MKKKIEISRREFAGILQALRESEFVDLRGVLILRWVLIDTADDGPEVAILREQP